MIDWSDQEDERLFESISSAENINHVLQVMRELTFDANWTPVIVDLLQQGKIETRCFASWFAQAIQPRAYLEIGVRRGFSMAMVASRAPAADVFGVDMWMPQYAGSENPGPQFVESELRRVGYAGRATFISGDSHEMLPAFFSANGVGWRQRRRMNRLSSDRPTEFDLMLVDGDHSLLGAAQDLRDTLPHLAVGGALIFDDVAVDPAYVDPEALRQEAGPDPYGWGDLLGVWRAVVSDFPHHRTYEYTSNTPGVAVAVRLQ